MTDTISRKENWGWKVFRLFFSSFSWYNEPLTKQEFDAKWSNHDSRMREKRIGEAGKKATKKINFFDGTWQWNNHVWTEKYAREFMAQTYPNTPIEPFLKQCRGEA